jgi:hypothetical protein
MPWTDVQKELARWWDTIWTNKTWFLAFPNRHAVYKLPGVGILSTYPDLMHCKHLGSDQYFYGSCLKFLTHFHMPGTPQDNLALVWGAIQEYYKEHRVPEKFGNLTLPMYVGKGGAFPRLKGRSAELRHFGEALHAVFSNFYDRSDQIQRQMLLGLRFSVKIEAIMDEFVPGEYKLNPRQYQEFEACVFHFLAICTKLGNHFHNTRPVTLLFNFTIKFHYLIHIAHYSKYWHPRLAWCYAGEDFMARIKKIVQGAHRGTVPWLVVGKVVQRYARGMGYKMVGKDHVFW